MIVAVSLLLVAMLSIQIGASFAKALFPLAGAAGTSGLRLLFATLILWIIWRPWTFVRSGKLSLPALKRLLPYGIALGLMNLTFYFALEKVPLGIVVTLEFIGPLTLTLLNSRQKLDFLWTLLAAVGVYCIVPQTQDAQGAIDVMGVLLALAAGFFWALYIFFGQRAGKSIHGGVATTIGMTVATCVTLPFGIVWDGPRLLNPKILPLALVVAALSSALPYSLEMMALKKLPAKTFGTLMSLEPAFASLVGLLVLKENLLPTQWLAISMIMAASAGSVVSASRGAKANPATLQTPE